tara:strand:+ start:71 stop:613 length:543 start_codon:yes stop_codon:yes gene_type:complete
MNSEYSPQSNEEIEQLDLQEKKLYDKLRTCKQVRDVLNSSGWRNIILPSLDRMIAEEVGGKLGNSWVYGKIQDEKSTDKIWFHIGKKQGLLEFHNHVHNYLKMIELIENQLKGVAEDRKGEFQPPMMEVQYAVQRKEEKEEKREEEVTHATKKRKVKRRKSTRKGNIKRTKKRRVQKGNK